MLKKHPLLLQQAATDLMHEFLCGAEAHQDGKQVSDNPWRGTVGRTCTMNKRVWDFGYHTSRELEQEEKDYFKIRKESR